MTSSDQRRTQAGDDDRSVSEIESDLEESRAQLGGTLEALGDRLDVKTRATQWAKATAERSQRQVKTLVDEHGRELSIAGGALVLATVAFLVNRGKSR